MKLMRKPIVLAAIGAVALIAVSCSGKSSATAASAPGGAAASSSQQTTAPYRTETHGNVTFQWRTNKGGTMDCVLSAPTSGWVAVGWGHDGVIKGSEIIIGYVKDGQATILDVFGDAENHVKLVTDLGNDDIVSNKSGSLENGTTKLHFTLRMHAIGDYHDPLNSGQTYEFIFLSGPEIAKDLNAFPGGAKPAVAEVVL